MGGGAEQRCDPLARTTRNPRHGAQATSTGASQTTRAAPPNRGHQEIREPPRTTPPNGNWREHSSALTTLDHETGNPPAGTPPIQGEIPMELRAKMADLGFFGMLILEEHGGLGWGLTEYAIVTEELSRAWMSVASIVARSQQFDEGWNADMRAKYLPAAARGEYMDAFALSEPDAGSDVAALSTRAVRDGDEWVITGQKMWCTFADGADDLLVFARTDSNVDPEHRAGNQRLHGPERARQHATRGQRNPDPQDRLPRVEDLGAVLRRIAEAGRVPHRRTSSVMAVSSNGP